MCVYYLSVEQGVVLVEICNWMAIMEYVCLFINQALRGSSGMAGWVRIDCPQGKAIALVSVGLWGSHVL